MKKTKKAGIWMDHSKAIVMEISGDILNEVKIESGSVQQDEEYSSEKHEKKQHTKEQHQQSEYYNRIGEKIKRFDEILLFGPTDAKSELANLLSSDFLFSKKKIEIRNTDKMTNNQMHLLVREYFK